MDEDEKAASYGKRMGKHIDKFMADGHSPSQATALAMSACAAEDEAGENPADNDDVMQTDSSGKEFRQAIHDEIAPVVNKLAQIEIGEKRNIPQSARDKLDKSDFAGPHQSFPIVKPEDVAAAAHSLGRAGGNQDAIKARIIAIAYRKGAAFVAQLPDAWKRSADKKSLRERIDQRLKELHLLPANDDPLLPGFKVVGDHWVAVWSTNTKDRDDEIFPEKAFESYIRRVDSGLVPKPALWVWHGGDKARIGEADMVGGYGHLAVALGHFDDTPHAQHAKVYYASEGSKQAVSHGFRYPADAFDGKHYWQFNTFEISLLPRGAEANIHTSFEEVKAMKLTDKKKQEFRKALGDEQAERLFAAWDEKNKAIDEQREEYKEFADPDSQDDPTEARKEAVEKANKAFAEIVPDLLEGTTEAIQTATKALKEIKALRDRIDEQAETIADLKEQLSRRPRSASHDPDTELDREAIKEALGKIDEMDDDGVRAFLKNVGGQIESQETRPSNFWGGRKLKSLNGAE